MPCTRIGGGYVCTSGARLQRTYGKCYGICAVDSRIVRAEGSPYYSPIFRCVECGDQWDCEGLFDRPFRKGWRAEMIKYNELLWNSACECAIQYDNEHYALPCNHDKENI